MAFQSNGVDLTSGLVPKTYLLDIYPSLSNVITTPSLWGWGWNTFGQLGDNTVVSKSSPVQTIAGGTNWKYVAGGLYQTAAIKSDGTLWMWGYNSNGELGDGTIVRKSSPIQTVAGGINWKQAAGGWFHTAAVKTDGTLWTWGHNGYGQLGDNTTVYKSSPVQTIAGGTNWKQVACGYYQTLAIKTDGTLWSCGYNKYGQLGTNNTTNYSSPVQTVTGGSNWKLVSTQDHLSAAIKTDGTLWTWGFNGNGQLGDNTIIHKSSPIQTIAGGTNWKQLVCNSGGTAAIKTDGTLWCWGTSTGDNTSISRSSPVQTISGGTNWRTIGCNRFNFLAIKTDGTLWSWGTDAYGLLGQNGPRVDRSSPVQTIMGGTNWKFASGGGRVCYAIADNDALGDARNPITSVTISGSSAVTTGNSYVYTALINYLAGPSSTDCTKLSWSTGSTSSTGSSTVTNVATNGVTVSIDGDGTDIITASDYNSSYNTTLSLSSGSFYGTLWSVGGNLQGQLGDNTIVPKSSPVQTIAGDTNWKFVASMFHTTAAIKTDGTLWSCGYNGYGKLGDNTTANKSSPVQTIAGGTNWKRVAYGMYHTTAIKTDGTLWTWGRNDYGQLGDNTTTHKSSPAQTIAGGTNWKMISAGVFHTSAIKTDGTLWVWGHNQYGQLGDNTVAHKSSPVQTIAGGTNWKMVANGYYHTVAIKTDGTMWAWGYNNVGPLGDNTTTAKSSPVQTIAGGTNWKHVSCGSEHTVAVKTDGTLWGWGFCGYGQLGDNTTANKSSPVQTITGGTSWRWVAAGWYHTAAIKTDGTMWLWGNNGNGQLGNNTTANKSSPVQTVIGGTNWKMVAAGMYNTTAIQESSTPYVTNVSIAGTTSTTMLSSYTYTATMTYNNGTTSTDCTLLNWSTGYPGKTGYSTVESVTSSSVSVSMRLDGTDTINATVASGATSSFNVTVGASSNSLWMCGYNNVGQLGLNTSGDIKQSPVQTISGGTNWKQADGGNHTVAIKADGTLWTWGNNDYGQLGDNTSVNKSSPVTPVTGGTNWRQVSCGTYHTAAIKTDGTLWIWGWNSNGALQGGALGTNDTTHRSSPIQTIAGGTNWKQVSCGQSHTAAIKTDGTLWLWGYNGFGQLGDGTRVNKSSPVQTITGGTNWKYVTCGNSMTAALKTDGTMWTWGSNNTGQLMDNTQSNRSSPVQVYGGGTNWKVAAFGGGHLIAIKTDGTLWGCGYNSVGQLGDGTNDWRSSPVQTVAGGNNWLSIDGGAHFTAAIKTDGTLWMWGRNNYGALGDNSLVHKSSPVQTVAGGTTWKSVACGYYHTIMFK